MPARFAGTRQLSPRPAVSAAPVASLARLLRPAALAAALLAAPAVASAQAAGADAVAAPEVENAKYQFEGVLIRPEFVRAGPGANFYPTLRLEAGARVVVTGAKSDFLKIKPPEGSFSYVPKAFVQLHGDGKQGRMTAPHFARAGSALQPVMWVVQAKLEPKDAVEVLGEEEQYFKIKPPAEAYVYIAKDAVKPGERVGGNAAGAAPPVAPMPIVPEKPADKPVAPPVPPPAPEHTPAADGSPIVSETPAPGTVTPPPPGGPATRDTGSALAEGSKDGSDGSPVVTAEQPAAAAKPLTVQEAVQKLQSLEKEFAAASQQPLADQPLPALTAGYEQVGSTPGVPDMTRRVAEHRLATLKVRTTAREQLAAVEASRKANQGRLSAHQAEHGEIRENLKKVEMPLYAAVGVVRASSLQVARTPIYRLTDPQTGRTVAYVWGTDPKVAASEGQFVGVNGQVQTDGRFNFKVVNPTKVEAVDASQMHTAYAAEIVPPSLRPTALTAPTAATPVGPEQ